VSFVAFDLAIVSAVLAAGVFQADALVGTVLRFPLLCPGSGSSGLSGMYLAIDLRAGALTVRFRWGSVGP